MIDAGLFVERAETFQSVKPQAWFDSPAQMLPTDEAPPANQQRKRQDDGDVSGLPMDEGEGGDQEQGDGDIDTPDAPNPDGAGQNGEPAPSPAPQGSFITEQGVTSTFTVTREMLDESNFEKLEHVTARMWITHERRGDVEVELKSPAGIVSVLARARRFDEDGNGFDGWKFMSLRHWYVSDTATFPS